MSLLSKLVLALSLPAAACRPPIVVGVLGCMAERLKDRLLDKHKLADIVVGPDAYRDLPSIIRAVQVGCCVYPGMSNCPVGVVAGVHADTA